MYYLIFLSIYLTNCFQSKREFVYKMQASRINYVIDTEWRLTLMKEQSKFTYRIAEFNSEKAQLGFENDTIIIKGTWRYSKDTLILSGTDIMNKCKADVKYFKQGNKLISLGACIDTSARGIRMPYLKKKK